MTIDDAKKISIEAFMLRNNYRPAKTTGNKLWFATDIGRSEKETKPSFVVDTIKNRFTDYGLGANGDIIDLVKLIYRVNTKSALEILARSYSDTNIFSFKGNKSESKPKNEIKIDKIVNVNNKSLIDYSISRAIPEKILKAYCSEIHYTNKGGKYFSLGFKNDSGGWELRSSIFKGCISPKAVTTMNGDSSRLNIFEGFFNFLSALKYFETDRLKYKTVILNTASNFRFLEEGLSAYQKINMFIDNDETGTKLKEKISLVNTSAEDISQKLYPNHNDFNDFIIEQAREASNIPK